MTSLVLPIAQFGVPVWVYVVAVIGFLIAAIGTFLADRKPRLYGPLFLGGVLIASGFIFGSILFSFLSYSRDVDTAHDTILKATGVDLHTDGDRDGYSIYGTKHDTYTGIPATLNGKDTICKIDITKRTDTHITIVVSCTQPSPYTPIVTK